MRRLLIMMSGIAALALVLAPVITAAPAAEVDVCHVNSANDVLVIGTFVGGFGRVISVSEEAVPAHLAHGDRVDFFDLSVGLRNNIEMRFGISVPNANCHYVIAGEIPGGGGS